MGAILNDKKIMLIGLKGDKGDKGDLGGTYPLGETDGTAYEGSKGKANAEAIAHTAQNLQMFYSIAAANGMFAVLETEQAYTTRQTANGAEIFDEQNTAVKEIKGGTVVGTETSLKHAFIKAIKSTGRNLFDKSGIDWRDYYDFSSCTKTSISEDKNVLIAKGGNSTDDFSFNAGWVQPNKTNLAKYGVFCEVGDVLTVSADITLLEQGARDAKVMCWVSSGTPSDQRTISTTKKRYTWQFQITKATRYAPAFAINSNYVQIENIKMSIGGGTEYEPYIEELYDLPQAIELGKWDSFNPQTGELKRQTETITFDGSADEGWTLMSGTYPYAYCQVGDLGTVENDAAVASRYSSNPNMSVSNNTECGYRVFNSSVGGNARFIIRPASDYDFSNLNAWLAELQSKPLTVSYKLAEPIIEKVNAPKYYKAWNHGSETVIQGETDNSAYGAMPTIKNEYFTAVGAEVETNE